MPTSQKPPTSQKSCRRSPALSPSACSPATARQSRDSDSPPSTVSGAGGPPSPAGGPRTAEGKAVSARNATTHGLFCRQAVLPHLGEDADGYKKVLDVLFEQFDPRTLMERQYLELWAEASWKLRRLSRWEAQLWEQDGLDEDARLTKLERVMRLQNTLRRQLDKAVRMLSRDVPEAQERYARRAVLASRSLTEADCREDPSVAYDVESAVQTDICGATGLSPDDSPKLDAAPCVPAPVPPAPDAAHENCQNEPPASPQGEAGPPTAKSLSPIPMGERCPTRAERGPSPDSFSIHGNFPILSGVLSDKEYRNHAGDNDDDGSQTLRHARSA